MTEILPERPCQATSKEPSRVPRLKGNISHNMNHQLGYRQFSSLCFSTLLRSCYYGRHATLLPQWGEALRDDPNNGCEGDYCFRSGKPKYPRRNGNFNPSLLFMSCCVSNIHYCQHCCWYTYLFLRHFFRANKLNCFVTSHSFMPIISRGR